MKSNSKFCSRKISRAKFSFGPRPCPYPLNYGDAKNAGWSQSILINNFIKSFCVIIVIAKSQELASNIVLFQYFPRKTPNPPFEALAFNLHSHTVSHQPQPQRHFEISGSTSNCIKLIFDSYTFHLKLSIFT